MQFEERALGFPCGGAWLYGILSLPQTPNAARRPDRRRRPAIPRRQPPPVHPARTRPGGRRHRRPALRLPRHGRQRRRDADFENVEEDLRAAIDASSWSVPGLRKWCCGACATAPRQPPCMRRRMRAWRPGAAQSLGAHRGRRWRAPPSSIITAAACCDRAFWRQLVRGVWDARLARCWPGARRLASAPEPEQAQPAHVSRNECMRACAFQGAGAGHRQRRRPDRTRILRPGRRDPSWKRLMTLSARHPAPLDKADHTFSRRVWRDQVAAWTCDWLRSWYCALI
jgi:hypothetical protein